MFKTNSEYIFQKNFKQLLICKRNYFTPAVQQFLQHPDKLIDSPETHYLKNNPNDTTTVGIIHIEDKTFVVKRYNVKSFMHGIKLWFRKSRAMTSWINAHRLMKINVPTIEPVAIIEKKFGPLRNKAYFVYRYVDGTPCCQYFEKHDKLTPLYSQALSAIANTMQKLRIEKIHHRDCHHNNMIMCGDKVLLLDLDHMKKYYFGKRRFAKAHQRDIQQFIRYLGNNEEAKVFFMRALENDAHMSS